MEQYVGTGVVGTLWSIFKEYNNANYLAKLNHRHTNANALCFGSFSDSTHTAMDGGRICLECLG